jgi:hypothetical protein
MEVYFLRGSMGFTRGVTSRNPVATACPAYPWRYELAFADGSPV